MVDVFHRQEPNRLRIRTLKQCITNAPWRIGIPFNALARRGHEIRTVSETQLDEFCAGDVLVLHNPSRAWVVDMVHAARQRDIRLVVDVDDLLLLESLPAHAKFARHWHPLRFQREAEERIRAGIADPGARDAAPCNDALVNLHECMREADVVTVSTPFLAAAYAHLNPNIQVLPNCFDDTQILWDAPRPPRPTINIGFLGTEHHGPNLELLRGVIEPVIERHPDVLVVEAGQGGLLERIQAPSQRLVHLGWFPFETFPLVLHQMDIVLAPLTDEPFMLAKSNIRCLTAGLVGAPVIASPIGPYADYVNHAINGYFAASPEEWTVCLDQLVADPCLRRQMGEQNRQTAHTYAISTNIERWETVYASV